MTAEEMLSTHEVDVAHLLAEHRAATDELRRLRAEVRRLQAWIIAAVNDGPDRDDAELSCGWLCQVVCAGPCEGVTPADPTGADR